MSPDYQAFLDAAYDITAERGEFALFLLFLREEMASVMSTSPSDSVNAMRWDVLLSAPWLAADRRAPLEYVAKKIQKHGGTAALRSIARLSAVPMSHPIVKRVMEATREPSTFIGPPSLIGIGGVSLIEPSLIGPGIAQAVLVMATRNPKAKRSS